MYPIIKEMFKGLEYDSVFEVGSAVGGLFEGLHGKFGGIDTHKGDHKAVKKLHPDGKWILQDAWETPWPLKDNEFDVVFTVGFFTVIDRDPIPVIKEMMRVGKQVILAEYHGRPLVVTSQEGTRVVRDWLRILKQMKLDAHIYKFSRDKTIIWLTKQDK